jgi:hypothetical protein
MILRYSCHFAYAYSTGDNLTDADISQRLDKIVSDLAKVKWDRGPALGRHRGKTTPTTKQFSVGGSKEYGHAIYRALTEQGGAGWKQIRA